jgi:hypothetical protein
MAMHRSFADWYESVSLHHDPKTLELRWKAVEQLHESLDIANVPGLVRTFFSLPGADSYREEIRNAAKAQDTSYLLQNDGNELTVLSGAVIATAVGKPTEVADATALAVSTADAEGMRKSPRIQGVVEETSNYLAEESVRTRRAAVSTKAFELDTSAFLKSLAAKGGVTISDANSVWSATEAVLKELMSLQSKHAKSVAGSANAMFKSEKEQSDILWWIVSEHTFDGAKPLSALKLPEACIWGARDLADLTAFLPGPLGASAFLHRMLRMVQPKLPESVKVTDCVDSCELNWKQEWLPKIPVQLPDLCPMLFGVIKSVESGGAKTWTAAFEHATGLKVGAKAAPERLAMQVYNELLLLRALTPKG